MAKLNRIHAVLIAIDQLANALLAGWPDETLSSRAYRCGELDLSPKRRWVIAHRLINWLFFWQKEHCRQAYLSELHRTHLPAGARACK